jgi:N-acetylglutamate synthase-like GNAT family acetyltransferase
MANDEMLREMARHRGFRLVKSRRRKAGGDFGRYGLTDAAGKQCFGFGKTGLTATPEQIESYLRSMESTSWRRSIGATKPRPAKKAPKAKEARASEAPSEPTARPARRTRARARAQAPAKPRDPRPPTRSAKPRAEPPPKPPEQPPKLAIRDATARDAAAIERLLGDLRGGAATAGSRKRLATLLNAGEPPLVADRGGVVGCIAWHVIPTLHRGKFGRVTLILVAESDRRQGIGRALLEAAEARLRKAGCEAIEAISDIAIVNAHGFFRSLGYAQASYRFTREATPR